MKSAKALVELLEVVFTDFNEESTSEDDFLLALLNDLLCDISEVVWDSSYDLRCLELLQRIVNEVPSIIKVSDLQCYVLILLYTNNYCRSICSQIGKVWIVFVVSNTKVM